MLVRYYDKKNLSTSIFQLLCPDIRPSATGGEWGAFQSRAIQITACASLKKKFAPLKRGLCPKESDRLGVTGVRSSSRPDIPKILVIHPVFMGKNRFFADFAMKILFFLVFTPKFAHFAMKTFFFSVFIPEFEEFRAYVVMKTFFIGLRLLGPDI